MNTLIISGLVLAILGIIGSIIPVLPGPALGYISLIFLYVAKPEAISVGTLMIFGIAMVALIVIDYVAPILGAKFSGASKAGLVGCVLGSLIGIVFFPPLGIFLGAFLGAFLGEVLKGKNPRKAIKAGIGTVLGSFSVIVLQTIFSLVIAIYFFWKVLI